MDEEQSFDVQGDDTSADSSQETNGGEDVSSEQSDTSTEGSQNAETPQQQKPSRANERITELIAERNRLQQQLQTATAPQAKQQESQNQFDGVTDEGIDPQKFSQSVLEKARAQAQTEVQRQVQIMEVSKDPAMKSQYAQLQVSALIDRGFTPMDALEAYKDQVSHIRDESSAKQQARDEAGKFSREGTQIPGAGKPAARSGSFTEADIAAMDSKTYEKNRDTIMKQIKQGLIT